MGASGASIYQGTLNGSGNLTSDGFLLNSSGLVIKKNAIHPLVKPIQKQERGQN